MKIPLSLGRDHAERKRLPIMRVLGYFTAALAGLTRHAVRGNDQHNPGQSLHWARGKSTDHAECVARHSFDMMDFHAWLDRNPNHPERESVLTELEHEYDARLWRAAADSQEFYEKYRGAPVSPSSVLPAAAPLIDYSHEIPILAAHDPGAVLHRMTFPPLVFHGAKYPSVWQGVSDAWYWNADVRHTGYDQQEYKSEAAARAAYWQWKDAAG